ncbi:MAG: nucleotidyltransferase family protein [Oscillospiraceae bacterium]|nr:nucleotidyltransferase family protein [Oscillospiraceae bacterium]
MINKKIVISADVRLLDALDIMDKVTRRLLIVCEDKTFLGVISIGDIQRAILAKRDLMEPVRNFLRKKVTFAYCNQNVEEIKQRMQQGKIECMPVVDEKHILVDTIEWQDLFDVPSPKKQEQLFSPVVIMAGGKGTRLRPITNMIPKPLIPISDKTIIEEIMDHFAFYGCTEFHISLNYMADVIKNYFQEHNENQYAIHYIQEDIPLGTAGSLYLLRDQLNKTFFVSNCDILTEVNLQDLMEYHRSSQNKITVVSVLKTFPIPYGTLETKENGILTELKEKPSMTYQINSGVYVLEPDVFKYIQDNEFLHITDLIKRLIDHKERVGVFPISDGSWYDMGNWEEYLKLVRRYDET